MNAILLVVVAASSATGLKTLPAASFADAPYHRPSASS